jgi:hypothetical protein
MAELMDEMTSSNSMTQFKAGNSMVKQKVGKILHHSLALETTVYFRLPINAKANTSTVT